MKQYVLKKSSFESIIDYMAHADHKMFLSKAGILLAAAVCFGINGIYAMFLFRNIHGLIIGLTAGLLFSVSYIFVVKKFSYKFFHEKESRAFHEIIYTAEALNDITS